jgi:hypothetical protein
MITARRCAGVTVLLAVFGAAVPPAAPQGRPESDVQTRQLWDDAFTKRRREPKPARPASSPKATSTAPSAGRPAARPPGASEDLAESLVGITVWHLRPVRPADAAQGTMVFNVGGQDLTAERVEVGAPLLPGERVRIGIESGRAAYLYLIDREQFADGSTGDPYLIFPTARIRAGDNRVVPGRLVEVPDLQDTPQFFTLQASRPDHVGELITVVLTTKPIADLNIGRSALKLTREQVEAWERAWAAPTRRIELPRGAGRVYTAAEREAGASTTRLLTHEEPVPQTMYQVGSKPGEPLMLNVPLGVKKQD